MGHRAMRLELPSHLFAVFPELGDPPAWTEESLQELNARNIEYNGKQYTRYEINQMQRARERNVRRWKKR